MPTTTANYTTLPGTLGGPLSQRRSGQSSFYLPDHQGNTRQLTSNAEAVTDTLLTDAWGVQIASSGTTVNLFKGFGRWGYYRDTTDQLYVRARFYRPTLAAWMSRDPLTTYPEYRYVRSEPVLRIDPSGLEPTYDPKYPCKKEDTDRIAEICKKIREMDLSKTDDKSVRARMAKCFRESMGALKAPYSCPPLVEYGTPGDKTIGDILKRIKEDLCGINASWKWIVQCNDAKDCVGCGRTLGLEDPKTGKEFGCLTHLCMQNLSTEGCQDLGGDSTIAALDFNILHEALHCAGVKDHGKWRDPTQCNVERDLPPYAQCQDALACCLWHILFGKTSGSWSKCARKIPG